MKTIGMVGIGLMGQGIASNIIRHGHPTVLFEHPGNQPLDQLLAAGATTCASLPQLAAQCDVILICVTGTPEVEDVLLKPDGLLEGLRPGTVIVDCSTAMPSSTRRIVMEVESRGGHFIDAPMTRTPKEAAQGRLNLMVGGNPDIYKALLPLLETYAENIVYAGPAGAGHQLKLIHNFVSMSFSAVFAEAAAFAEKAGISSEVLLEVVSKGGGNSVVVDRFKPFLQSGDVNSFRFYIANALKDLEYYAQMAEELGAYRESADSIRRTYAAARAVSAPDATVPELVNALAKLSQPSN